MKQRFPVPAVDVVNVLAVHPQMNSVERKPL